MQQEAKTCISDLKHKETIKPTEEKSLRVKVQSQYTRKSHHWDTNAYTNIHEM